LFVTKRVSVSGFAGLHQVFSCEGASKLRKRKEIEEKRWIWTRN
jgi:hypothetical protein